LARAALRESFHIEIGEPPKHTPEIRRGSVGRAS